MSNRLLSITRSSIPYIKELNRITGSMAASILMQQLDYWFHRYPDGFYKFLEPSPNHVCYKASDSWTEEIGISKGEFRTAFDSIGYRHATKAAFLAAQDKFLGRMYASYIDKKTNLTHYVRNHALVDQRLDDLIASKAPTSDLLAHSFHPEFEARAPQINSRNLTHSEPRSVQISNRDVTHHETQSAQIDNRNLTHHVSQSAQINKPNLTDANSQSAHDVNRDVSDRTSGSQGIRFPALRGARSEPVGIGFPHLPTTDNTKENTKQLLQTAPPTTEQALQRSSSSSVLNNIPSQTLHYPNITGRELKSIEALLVTCDLAMQQDVLDEIEGIRLAGKIVRGPVPLARTLIAKVASNEFSLSAGIAVQAQREQRMRTQSAVRQATAERSEPVPITQKQIDSLPTHMRARAEQALRETELRESKTRDERTT